MRVEQPFQPKLQMKDLNEIEQGVICRLRELLADPGYGKLTVIAETHAICGMKVEEAMTTKEIVAHRLKVI